MKVAPWGARVPAVTLLALLAAPVAPVQAQQEQSAVLGVVRTFFQGMKTKDTTLIRTTIDPTGRLLGIEAPRGEAPRVHATSMDDFLGVIAKAVDELDEVIYEPEVRIDGALATVWAAYDITIGGRFSHCGIDAFQLLKVGDAWKITQIADTRRPQGCTTPRAPRG